MNIYIRNTACGILATVLLSAMFFTFSNPARAQSTSAKLEQIQALLALIEQLQAQLAELRDESSITGQCLQLSRSLYLGISDRESLGEVSRLQRFLTNTGHYTYGEITGYYGPATQRAVQLWQASNGVVSSGSPETTGYGVVGPSTRGAIARGCIPKPVAVPVEVDEEDALDVSVTSISDSENPTVKGKAFGTDVVGFSVGDGDKVYGSGDITVINNRWTHRIATDLEDGRYTLTVYVNNEKVDRKTFEVDTATEVEEASPDISVITPHLINEEVDSGDSVTYVIQVDDVEDIDQINYYTDCDSENVVITSKNDAECNIATYISTSEMNDGTYVFVQEYKVESDELVTMNVAALNDGYEYALAKDTVSVNIKKPPEETPVNTVSVEADTDQVDSNEFVTYTIEVLDDSVNTVRFGVGCGLTIFGTVKVTDGDGNKFDCSAFAEVGDPVPVPDSRNLEVKYKYDVSQSTSVGFSVSTAELDEKKTMYNSASASVLVK